MSEWSRIESPRGDLPDGLEQGSLVRTTIKAVLGIAVVSWLAAIWISSSDGEKVARLAGLVGKGAVEEPLTTGSIGGRAGSTRLDPCALPGR